MRTSTGIEAAIPAPVKRFERQHVRLAAPERRDQRLEGLARVLELEVHRRQFRELFHGVTEIATRAFVDLRELERDGVEHIDLVRGTVENAPEPHRHFLAPLALGDIAHDGLQVMLSFQLDQPSG
jgi:hypothetical protein